ncbi:MAG: hypothetical protein JSW47_11705 [Phycisphaerales bacterium]|nr:MAG: hypothetical protein JSW47_11705 [Phycisphaerales bacterium]
MKIETFVMERTQCQFENKNNDQISIVDLTPVAIQDIYIAKMVNRSFTGRKV